MANETPSRPPPLMANAIKNFHFDFPHPSLTQKSVHSSPSLLSEYFWYDKLWGPSQRVVTLFLLSIVSCFLKAYQVVDQEWNYFHGLSQVENSRQGPLTLHQLLVIGVEETEILIMRWFHGLMLQFPTNKPNNEMITLQSLNVWSQFVSYCT